MADNKVVSILRNKWFIHGLGLLLIALLIWFVGPIISIAQIYFLETVSSRLFTILLVIVAWAVYQYTRHYLRLKNDAKFAENLTLKNAKQDEVNTIQDRFNEAIQTLKTGKDKKEDLLLNSLPWYIIIGPPGSGKTTALLNSGLQFPLKDKLGADAVKGIGGTRHCDWWFTNEAVLIDTAGRFTTQDSDSEIDKTAWQSFMSLLKKHRKQRPINGALVTMSLSDMLTLSDDERTYYAKTIRKRIEELNQELKVQFPVYFMFTKCDLVSGFTSFFSSLTAKQRNQVWGETFELSDKGESGFDVDDYDLHYEQLIERLNTQLLLHLKQQNDPNKKADILSFPAQMESMKESIHQFLKDIFGANKYQESALLRGVYFTSGTQQGSPFDSLLGSLASDMGLSDEDDVNYSGRGKSYFISELLSNVIFPESNIAGVDLRYQRWIKRIQLASVSLACIALIGFIGIWYVSYKENIERIKSVEHSVQKQEQLIIDRGEKQATFDLILPELNAARESTQLFEPKSFVDNFGLNQKSNFDNQTQAIYLNVLETRLLPLVASRLEEIMVDITQNGNAADLYGFLKAYLMYAGQHNIAEAPLEKDWLVAMASIDWMRSFDDKPQMTEQLINHLDYLLLHNFAYIEPNEKVVQLARGALLKLPLEEQAYASVKDTLLSSNEGDLPFSRLAGPKGLDVFSSKSNKRLSEVYIPGMFTKEGFLTQFVTTASGIVDEYLSNTWILGEHNKADNVPSSEELQDKVYALYYREYINVWQNFVRDLEVVRFRDQQQAIIALRDLTENNNPVKTLINSVSSQTNLTEVASTAGAAKGVGEVASVVSSSAQRVVSQANRISRAADKTGLVSLPGAPVSKAFDSFHQLTSSERGDPKIIEMAVNMAQYQEFIDQTLNDNFSDAPAFEVTVGRINGSNRSQFGRLTANSSANPREVNNWLNQISNIGWQLLMSQTKVEIDRAWSAQVYNVYFQALQGRYPFDTRASSEVEINDFANFFKPKGTIDTFIKTYIEPFVNTRTTNWQIKTIGGSALNIKPSSLARLQRTNQVTRYFFAPSASMPNINFSLLPLTLDRNVARFTMNIGTQNLVYAHGPRRATNFTWPVSMADESARIEFITPDRQIKADSELGPWSLFKLLDKHQLNSTGRQSTYQTKIDIDGLSIDFELRASSEFNPIGDKTLHNLSLPEEL